jgi:hypothetical protein
MRLPENPQPILMQPQSAKQVFAPIDYSRWDDLDDTDEDEADDDLMRLARQSGDPPPDGMDDNMVAALFAGT